MKKAVELPGWLSEQRWWTAAELDRRGLSDHARGRLVRVHHGVYAVSPPLNVLEDAQAAARVLRGDKAFGFETAAQLRGLPGVRSWQWSEAKRLHVIPLDGSRTRLSTVTSHRPSAAIRAGTVAGLAVPVVDGADTFAHLARTLVLDDLVLLGDAVVGWGSGADPSVLEAAVRPGAAGAARAREALELIRPGSGSPMETRARLEMVRGGLPEPELNVPVMEGNRWLATVDFLWRRHRLVAEYQGGYHFATEEQRLEDLHRLRRLRDHNYRVEEITKRDIRWPAVMVARMRQALAQQERLLGLV